MERTFVSFTIIVCRPEPLALLALAQVAQLGSHAESLQVCQKMAFSVTRTLLLITLLKGFQLHFYCSRRFSKHEWRLLETAR